MTPTITTDVLFLHPSDRIKRRAVLHLIDSSALAAPGVVTVHPDRVVLHVRLASSGHLRLWRFAEALAEQGGTLFALRETDEECRRAAVEALAIWCGQEDVPAQRGHGGRPSC